MVSKELPKLIEKMRAAAAEYEAAAAEPLTLHGIRACPSPLLTFLLPLAPRSP